jgi:regulator of protease activity HflC (stomatin/prohibitin superfamily)
MGKFKIFLNSVFVVFVIHGCQFVSPNAGQEAVLVDQPYLFGHGGVRIESIKTGRTIEWFSTQVVYVNMQPIQFGEHFDDLMSLDGVPLDFDAVLRMQVKDSIGLIKNFGQDWYNNNMQSEFRNRVRQAVRKHGMNETAISTKAIEEIDNEISSSLVKYIDESKLPISLIQITVGKANPPDMIKSQRIETAAQQQRKLTEEQKKIAEDSRKQAEISRASADNSYRNAMSLSPDQFLRLESIKMQKEVCNSGKCVFIFSSGGISPIINTK